MPHLTTRRADGDFRVDGDEQALAARRVAAVANGPWTWLRQEHGTRVVRVDEPGQHAGSVADAAVTATPGAVLAVHTADCAPVVFEAADGGVVGVAHAGWRGLVAGVLESTLAAMRELGATEVSATVGPHVRARCYEFGPDDLALVADRVGDAIRSHTAWGTDSLDLMAGIRAVLEPLGVPVEDDGGCTACEPERYFSHRARADTGRMATCAWSAGPPDRPAR